MKFLAFLIGVSAHAMASDFGGVEKCGPLKFKYYDVVEVLKGNFYEGCQGKVSARSSDCTYYVIQLCDNVASHFEEKELKIVKKRERCK